MIRFLTVLGIAILTYCCKTDTNIQTEIPENKNIKIGINIGGQAPNLQYPDPEGKMISLYSLRGKLVLIDFWASWCPPCRIENPKLVAIYKEFKDKKFCNGDGFTVYSISCDFTKEAWVDAIKKDQLIWDNQVSDLKGWEAEATYIFNINSIPSNVLIDGKGIILAKNLHGETLKTYLETLLAEQ
jgi:thiol-disulfide isomerase/thioredoxin